MAPRVLTVPAPAFRDGRLRPVFPIGLHSIKAVAREAGFDIDILDGIGDEDPTLVSASDVGDATLARFDPGAYDIVGLSTIGGSLSIVLRIAAAVKARSPSTLVVTGGPQTSFLAAETLRDFPYIDAVVVGEGELTFADMLRSWTGLSDAWSGIPGVRTRGAAFVPRPLVTPLDALPLPVYDARVCARDSVEYLRIEALRGCAPCSSARPRSRQRPTTTEHRARPP